VGGAEAELQKVETESAAAQVVTPSFRLPFGVEEAEFKRSAGRELGEVRLKDLGLIEALLAAEPTTWSFWNDLPKRLTLEVPSREKSKVRSLSRPVEKDHRAVLRKASGGLERPAQKWFRSQSLVETTVTPEGLAPLRELIEGLEYSVLGSTDPDRSALEVIHRLALGRTGAGFTGGMTAYRELLMRLAGRLGVQIPERTECRRVFFQSGRFVGVQASHQGNMISTQGGVIGCSLSHLREKLHSTGTHLLHRLKPSPRPLGWRFTIALTVDLAGLNPGLGRRLFWREEGAPPFEIEVSRSKDFGLGKDEDRQVFLRCVLPFDQKSLDLSFQRQVAGRMVRQFLDLNPFADDRIERVFPDFRPGVEGLSEVYGFASPEMIPENLRVFEGAGVGSRSGIEGLFLATGEAYPGLGTLGPTVAALESVAWLAHRNGLAGPIR
jgi:hypothetical protein